MLVLDTTILIDALHGKKAALRKIVELEETGRNDMHHANQCTGVI